MTRKSNLEVLIGDFFEQNGCHPTIFWSQRPMRNSTSFYNSRKVLTNSTDSRRPRRPSHICGPPSALRVQVKRDRSSGSLPE